MSGAPVEQLRQENGAHSGPGRPGRRRVVMLVANGVRGDSRVQKAARSMAARGWDTVLVGRAPGTEREEFAEGGARVVLVPVAPTVSGRGRAAQGRWMARDLLRGRQGGGPGGRHGGGRVFNPWFEDLEAAYAPVVAELRPDLIHGHDYHMLGVSGRLASRLSRPGDRPVRWLYDCHEYLAGVQTPRAGDLRGTLRRRALLGMERAYAPKADAVVTVSSEIARRLTRDHRLPAPPAVVLNAPVLTSTNASVREGAGPDVRAAAGLPAHVPVLVYSGGLAPQRGVATVIEALPGLAGAHLVLVARDGDPDLPRLRAAAARARASDRVHVVPYVEPHEVVRYLSGATAGVVPLLHRPNHELSLITKYLEYAAARLPILTSDVREMAATTRRLGVGEVFRAGDAHALARAARRLLAAPERYRNAYRAGGEAADLAAGGWERQAGVLDGVYRRLLET